MQEALPIQAGFVYFGEWKNSVPSAPQQSALKSISDAIQKSGGLKVRADSVLSRPMDYQKCCPNTNFMSIANARLNAVSGQLGGVSLDTSARVAESGGENWVKVTVSAAKGVPAKIANLLRALTALKP